MSTNIPPASIDLSISPSRHLRLAALAGDVFGNHLSVPDGISMAQPRLEVPPPAAK